MGVKRYDKRSGKTVVTADAELHPYAYSAKVRFIGLKEIASYLGVTIKDAEEAVTSVAGPSLRHIVINGHIRCLKADFTAWLRARTRFEYHYERADGGSSLPPSTGGASEAGNDAKGVNAHG